MSRPFRGEIPGQIVFSSVNGRAKEVSLLGKPAGAVQGRLQAARRGSLHGPSTDRLTMVFEPRQGLLSASLLGGGGTLAVVLRSSKELEGQTVNRLPSIYSPRLGGMETFGRNPVG